MESATFHLNSDELDLRFIESGEIYKRVPKAKDKKKFEGHRKISAERACQKLPNLYFSRIM